MTSDLVNIRVLLECSVVFLVQIFDQEVWRLSFNIPHTIKHTVRRRWRFSVVQVMTSSGVLTLETGLDKFPCRYFNASRATEVERLLEWQVTPPQNLPSWGYLEMEQLYVQMLWRVHHLVLGTGWRLCATGWSRCLDTHTHVRYKVANSSSKHHANFCGGGVRLWFSCKRATMQGIGSWR